MNFNLIDIEKWQRKDHYLHYMSQLRCTFSLTTNIDITGLKTFIKKANKRIYPVQIHMLATVVNQYQEFRMNYNANGVLGYWDELNPSYTVFNKSTETFSSIWTEYKKSFDEFYKSCIHDIDEYSQATCLMPKPNQAPNTFTISSLPWTSFTGFNINVFNDGNYLPPIFTLGKFIEQDGKVLMPVAIQVHHAVCDGFHIGKFINSLQQLADNYDKWVNK